MTDAPGDDAPNVATIDATSAADALVDAPSSQIRITGFVPPTEIPVGQVLTIRGDGFAFPPEDNVLAIDGMPISAYRAGSTSVGLVFVVPSTLNVPAGGKTVTISLTNTRTAQSVTGMYRLWPALPLVGSPPVVDDVQPDGGFRFVGLPVHILGRDFASPAIDNIVTFTVVTPEGAIAYPSPVFDIARSTTTDLVVQVPDIAEIPSGQSRDIRIEVRKGNHVPAMRMVSVRRM